MAVPGLAQQHAQVEPGYIGPGPDRGDPDAGQATGYGGRVVLHGQQHLEQRVAGQGPVRGQVIDQPLERNVLMIQRPQPVSPDPAQDLGELGVPG